MNSTHIAKRVKFYEEATRKHLILSSYDKLYVNNFSPIRKVDRQEIYGLWQSFLKNNPSALLSLYIHIPYCRGSKCFYCMYNSFFLINSFEMNVYLDDLEEDIRFFSPLFKGRQFTTLYIGGGTPSLLTKEQLRRLFKGIFYRFDFKKDRPGRKCLEVSPATVTKSKISLARDSGIDRISMGVQSMDRDVLRACNRVYTPLKRLKNLVTYIKKAGFADFNVDLMAWLPADTIVKFMSSFRAIMDMGVPSITVYFYRHEPVLAKKFSALGNAGHFLRYEYPYERKDLLDEIAALLKNDGYPYTASMNENSEYQVFHKDGATQLLNNPTEYFADLQNSTFGFGTFSRSFMENSVAYFKDTEGYLLKEFPLHYQMRQYAVREFEREGKLSFDRFREMFKKDFRDVFKDELQCLRFLKKIEIRDGCAVFSSRDMFDFSIYSKFFYDQQILKRSVESLK